MPRLAVVAIWATSRDSVIVSLHNRDDRPCNVRLDLNAHAAEEMIELLSDSAYPTVRPLDAAVQLEPFGYRWFRSAASP